MITADPERDDPEKVAAYVERFHPEFVGLSGARPDLEAVWQQFAVYVEKQNSDSAAGYLVSHTSSVFVLDPQGNLVMTFPYGTSALDMTRDIQELMRQARHN
jgi:protein SCO1/2